MSVPNGIAQSEDATVQDGAEAAEEALRSRHAARARSAVARALAACRRAGVEDSQAKLVPNSPESKAAHAVRLSQEAVARLDNSSPDPAADARCARNASATATLAAQVAQAQDSGGDLAHAAYRSALRASMAAAEAAGAQGMGRDEALNAKAEEAESAAVSAAEEAGWM
jgi:hypothetical protein